MGIAKVTDTGDAIILACTMLEESGGAVMSAIGSNGVVVGTATIDTAKGVNPGDAGSVTFDIGNGSGALTYEGQVVLTISNPETILEYDDSASISGSTGNQRLTTAYILSIKNTAAALHGRIFADVNNALRGSIHEPDTDFNQKSTDVGKGSEVELCFWWFGNSWGMLIDGIEEYEGARTAAADFDLDTLVIGARETGTLQSIDGTFIKNIVVSRNSPRLKSNPKTVSVAIGGDSFSVAGYELIQTPKYDAALKYNIQKGLSARGFEIDRFVDAGHSGFTVCDTATNNLSANFSELTTIENAVNIVVYLASNNDVDAATAPERDDAGTGTVANYRTLLADLYATKRTNLVILTTAGSLKGDAVLDTESHNISLAEVTAMVEGLESWADTNLEVGFVKVINLLNLLGNATTSRAYQGVLNAEGNATIAATALNDRHPSPIGHALIGDKVAELIAQVY